MLTETEYVEGALLVLIIYIIIFVYIKVLILPDDCWKSTLRFVASAMAAMFVFLPLFGLLVYFVLKLNSDAVYIGLLGIGTVCLWSMLSNLYDMAISALKFTSVAVKFGFQYLSDKIKKKKAQNKKQNFPNH